jgi:hypothetical protein
MKGNSRALERIIARKAIARQHPDLSPLLEGRTYRTKPRHAGNRVIDWDWLEESETGFFPQNPVSLPDINDEDLT